MASFRSRGAGTGRSPRSLLNPRAASGAHHPRVTPPADGPAARRPTGRRCGRRRRRPPRPVPLPERGAPPRRGRSACRGAVRNPAPGACRRTRRPARRRRARCRRARCRRRGVGRLGLGGAVSAGVVVGRRGLGRCGGLPVTARLTGRNELSLRGSGLPLRARRSGLWVGLRRQPRKLRLRLWRRGCGSAGGRPGDRAPRWRRGPPTAAAEPGRRRCGAVGRRPARPSAGVRHRLHRRAPIRARADAARPGRR